LTATHRSNFCHTRASSCSLQSAFKLAGFGPDDFHREVVLARLPLQPLPPPQRPSDEEALGKLFELPQQEEKPSDWTPSRLLQWILDEPGVHLSADEENIMRSANLHPHTLKTISVAKLSEEFGLFLGTAHIIKSKFMSLRGGPETHKLSIATHPSFDGAAGYPLLS